MGWLSAPVAPWLKAPFNQSGRPGGRGEANHRRVWRACAARAQGVHACAGSQIDYGYAVDIRTVIRGVVVGGSAAAVLLATSPALAQIEDDGAEPGDGLSTLETLLIFGAIPLGLFLLIALLVMAPSIARGPRYRADRRWTAQPQVFGAAEDALADDQADAPAAEQGGSSARW